jgi:type IV pilus assembly protein PilK
MITSPSDVQISGDEVREAADYDGLEMMLMKPSTSHDLGFQNQLVKKLPQLDDAQFQLWADLLKARTGMRLPDNRRSFLATNLGIRMRELEIYEYQTYYDFITSGLGGTVEWERLLHHLTVHETRFLRQESVLSLISDAYLPQKAADCGDKPLDIHVWSVGCSTGEEPYSVAMAIDDYMQRIGCNYYMGVTASDISRDAIAIGREGIYSAQRIKDIDPHWRRQYFDEVEVGTFQVRQSLRSRVCFNQLNILDMGKAPIGQMDIIVCQNLLIYFDREQRIQIANTLAEKLLPGGLLILGVGELVRWEHPQLKRYPYANTLAYQRV